MRSHDYCIGTCLTSVRQQRTTGWTVELGSLRGQAGVANALLGRSEHRIGFGIERLQKRQRIDVGVRVSGCYRNGQPVYRKCRR